MAKPPPLKDVTALAVVFYDSARTEMIERIKLRDQSLIAYIATAGAYFGFIVQDNTFSAKDFYGVLKESAIVIVLPVISLVFSFIILQHHIMIGKIGLFVRRAYADHEHWDADYASWVDKRYLSARTFSQGLLLLIPLAYTADFSINIVSANIDYRTILVGAGLIITDCLILGTIVYLHIWAYGVRKETDTWSPSLNTNAQNLGGAGQGGGQVGRAP